MEPLSTVLFSLFRGTAQHAEWVLACLEGAWQGIVGERLAAVCRPSRFSNGQLTVLASDSEWRTALLGVQHDLALRIREATAGEVREIRIVTSEVVGPD
jgi:predicted nucleic acid-binding Zn ribbon protein